MQQQPSAPRKIVGWERIAAYLDVEVARAKRLRQLPRDPLPVEDGPGCVFAFDHLVRAWLQRQPIIGWEKIAAFLGMGTSTARRYAGRSQDPLPVFNAAENLQCVAAKPDDLKRWQERQAGSARRRPRISRAA